MRVLEIRHVNKQNLTSISNMLMSKEFNYAAGGVAFVRNNPHLSNHYLVKMGDQEFHNWHIVYVETKNIKRAERMVNSGKFNYIMNQIPITEEIDKYL